MTDKSPTAPPLEHGNYISSVAGLRRRLATVATLVVGGASRRLGFGGGSVIGGRVGLAIDRNLVGGLAVGRRCALVSGTNGKTTTTRLLAAALGGPGAVASSSAGANLPAGVAAALARAPQGAAAVLEVDEGYLGRVAAATCAQVIVLLNLSRDQLDRVNEVRKVAARWREAFSGSPSVTVVANADDPLVAWAAGVAPMVRFVAAGGKWHGDATGCPACGGRIVFDDEAGWSCGCGFARPELYARLVPEGLELRDGRVVPFELSIPGRFNRANAAMAAVAAGALGVDEASALGSMALVRDVEGRFSVVDHDDVRVRVLLAKNPAGWGELLELLVGSELPVVIGINARIADGRDPSWLWDVEFERLVGRQVIATGERANDLAVRLEYAGVEHRVARNQLGALELAGAPEVEYVGNYTAFQQLRRSLSGGSVFDSSHLWARLGGHRDPNRGSRAAQLRVARPVPEPTQSPTEGPADRRHLTKKRHVDSSLRVAVVLPDLLGTYGDTGNGRVLACRAGWRGLPVELVLARSGRPIPTADIYCLGGGEDSPQVEAAKLVRESRIASSVDAGAAVLAVCAGFQIIGQTFPDGEGHICDGAGLLDVATVPGRANRSVGELVADPYGSERCGGERARPEWAASEGLALTRMTGFENHAALTSLGPGARPLGRVLSGTGNGDGTDGAVCGRVVATYMHGPVLARNPALADLLLYLATGLDLEPLDDIEEEALRAERLERAGYRDGPGSRLSPSRWGRGHRAAVHVGRGPLRVRAS